MGVFDRKKSEFECFTLELSKNTAKNTQKYVKNTQNTLKTP
jgi:hypothetical protein